MSSKKIFTTEEVEALRANPYTVSVTPAVIRFTLDFKKEFWRLSAEGCTGNQAFRKLATIRTSSALNVSTISRSAFAARESRRGVSRSGYYNWLNSEQHRQQCEAQDKFGAPAKHLRTVKSL